MEIIAGHYSLITILAAVVLMGIGILVIRSTRLLKNPMSFGLLLSAVLWLLAMAGAAQYPELGGKLVFSAIQYSALSLIGPFLLGTALGFFGRIGGRGRLALAAGFLVSALFVAAIAGNGRTGWFFSSQFLAAGGVLTKVHGVLYYWYTAYLAALAAVSMAILGIRSASLPFGERRRVRVLVLSFAVGTAGALGEAAGLAPFGPNGLIPLALTIAGLILAWGIIKARLLSPILLAQEILVDSMADPVIVSDAAGRVMYANAAAQALALQPLDSPERTLQACFPGVGEVAANDRPAGGSLVGLGGRDWMVRATEVSSPAIGPGVRLTVMHDVSRMTAQTNLLDALVTERTALLKETNLALAAENARYRQSQDEQAKLLKEKEMLLQELHHRVKNNLQIIISLLTLQTNRLADDDTAKPVLQEMRGRVRSIGLVHERMYRSDLRDALDFGDYLAELVQGVAAVYDQWGNRPALDIPRGVFRASVDFCVDIGLVINELVTNAFKHGVIPHGGGSVAVSLVSQGGEALLAISDPGPGLAAWPEASGRKLGMNIVRSILSKYRAHLEFAPEGVSRLLIRLPLTAEDLSCIGPVSLSPDAAIQNEEGNG